MPVYGAAANKTAVAMGRETRMVEGDRVVIIYIAGKLTNDPGYKEKFRQAERHIKAEYPGAYIFNPAALPEGLTPEWYMDICQKMIKVSDLVIFLPDYTESKGARMELAYCNYIGVTALIPGIDFAKKEPLRNGNSEKIGRAHV